jgi:hypothetical protein
MALLSRVKTWIAETLTASDLNAEFDNILNGMTPDYVEDASANATAMQTTADPYPAAAASLATTLRGELQRLRYVIAQITGETYWYIDPDTTLAALYGMTLVDEIWIPAGAMIPLTTNGAQAGTTEFVTTDLMFDYLAFDTATEEFAAFNIVMPPSWNLGTVKAKFFWSPGTA